MAETKTETMAALGALAEVLAGREVVDLTVTLAENMPANWPTHMPFQRKVYNWYEARPNQIQPIHGFRGPYHTAWLVLDEHCGTHVDAPAHFVGGPDSGVAVSGEVGSITAEQLDLTKLMGPAAVIDASDLTEQGSDGVCVEISADRVRQWEAEHGALQPGEIVLFRTGWDKRYRPMTEGGSEYVFDPFILHQGTSWPTPDVGCIEYLHEKGIVTVGLDGVSVGPAHNGVPHHQFGLARGMLYLELLANLDQLPPRGAYFIFLPLKIQGGSAGPGRAIALVEK